MRFFFVISFSVLFSVNLLAQKKELPKFSFGFHIMMRGKAQTPVTVLFDSVATENDDGGLGSPLLCLFAEREIKKFLTLRAEFNYIEQTNSGYLIYDLKTGPLGFYYIKAITIPSPSIQIPIMATLKMPGFPYLSILGGFDSHFQFRKKIEDFPYNWDKFYSHRATDVLNALPETPKSYVPFWIFGARMDVWRFAFIARYEKSTGNSYTRNLVTPDKSYPFYTHRYYANFSLSYKFYSLKIKKKKNPEILKPR
jgi:hypothetical protein